MRLRELTDDTLKQRCNLARLVLQIGPFDVRVGSRYQPLVDQLGFFYSHHDVVEPPCIADFHVRMRRPQSARRWWRPQIDFYLDAERPFEPYPLEQALPLFEWGLNWCIATHAHHLLMLHAAVLEREGRALLLPATPGSGKSTLCAALAHRGWRMLSDEFGLLHTKSGQVWPLPKPIPLKNQSIEVIRLQIPEAIMGPVFRGTRKGDVAHVKPPEDSATRQRIPAKPTWILFPGYRAGSVTRLTSSPRSLSFIRLSRNAFNYRIKGEEGFLATAHLARNCSAYELVYSDLSEAIDTINRLEPPRED